MIDFTPAGAILDALLLASLTAIILVGAAVGLSYRRGWSAHLRRRLIEASVLAVVVTAGLTAAVSPGPAGCIAIPCHTERPRDPQASRAAQAATAAAAGKFADLVPVEVEGATRGGGASPSLRNARQGLGSLLLLLWIAGASVAAARVARRRWLAFRIVRDARPVRDPGLQEALRRVAGRVGLRGAVRLLHHPSLGSPVVAGTVRPALLLPTADHGEVLLSQADAELVFLHELAHVRTHDPATTLGCEIVCALFWFHPLLRLATRRARELQEIAADSVVLRGGVRPSTYASYLLNAVRRAVAPSGSVLADQHPIAGDCIVATRLRTILDPTSPHDPPRRSTVAGLTGGALAVAGLIALAPLGMEAGGVFAQQGRDPAPVRADLLNPQSLDSLLRPAIIDHMADRYIAGAAVAVVHGGEVVYQAGFGRREVFHEDPVDVERTIWRIGSITKVLTGIAVLQLVDRGLLDLDADVNTYFDEPIVPASYPEPVLVRHLLTHTAGFDQVGLGRHVDSAEEVRPLEDFLREYLGRVRPPGVLSTYDTYGITLAGLLVERRSGMAYDEYLQRHIFAPLEMHRAGIDIPPALASDVAVGYSFAGHWEAERWEYMNTAPASTANASVPGMANVARMLLAGGRFGDRRILSEGSARAMLTRQFTNHPDHPGYSYTLWEEPAYGVPAFQHGGSMAGFGSMMYLAPEQDLAVVIAYNQESGSLAHRVVETVVGALVPERAAVTMRRPLASPPDPARFEGTYANSMYHHANPETGWRRRPFTLAADADGRLEFQGAPAVAVGPLTFQRADGLLLSFLTDERGAVSHLVVNQTVYEKVD